MGHVTHHVRTSGKEIKLCCAKCGFTIEDTPLASWQNSAQAKRYKYLLNQSEHLPVLFGLGRLKEVRATGETVAAPMPQVEGSPPPASRRTMTRRPKSDTDAGRAGARSVAQPRHRTQADQIPGPDVRRGLQKRTTQWGYGGYVSLPASPLACWFAPRPVPTSPKARTPAHHGSCGNLQNRCYAGALRHRDKYGYGLLHLLSTGGDLEMLGFRPKTLGPQSRRLPTRVRCWLDRR